MKKFARLAIFLHQITRIGSRNGFPSKFYSSNAAMPSQGSVKPSEGSIRKLYSRISPVGDRKISIVPILDQWVEEGRPVDQQTLKYIIKKLRHYKRYTHALEVSMWMTDKRYFELTSSDTAIRLHLISKARGVEQAEKYFNNLSTKKKGTEVYCALHNCYATSQCVEKAEAVMQEIRDLGYAKKATEYNLMLNLYYKTGNMEKLDALLQEMEENGIAHDKFTLGILLTAYAAVSNIEKMDKIMTTMESDPKFFFDWTSYTAATAGYSKAGLMDKALEMLKKAEARVPAKGYVAYNYLLTQYATIGRKDEVLRVWSLYKKKFKVYNKGYSHVLNSFLKLGDFEMAEEIFNEWESRGEITYDMNIPNIMIKAYSKKGLFEKAETLLDRAVSKGGKPNAWTWHHFVEGYLHNEQPEKAVEMMKKTIVLLSGIDWEPVPEVASLNVCLKYLKGVGDAEQTEEFVKLLVDKDIISLDKLEDLSIDDKDDRISQG